MASCAPRATMTLNRFSSVLMVFPVPARLMELFLESMTGTGMGLAHAVLGCQGLPCHARACALLGCPPFRAGTFVSYCHTGLAHKSNPGLAMLSGGVMSEKYQLACFWRGVAPALTKQSAPLGS